MKKVFISQPMKGKTDEEIALDEDIDLEIMRLEDEDGSILFPIYTDDDELEKLAAEEDFDIYGLVIQAEDFAQFLHEIVDDEFDAVINALRSDRTYSALLESRRTLSNYCWSHPNAKILSGYDDYGFRLDTADHTYMLRLNPQPGMYNIYCYCYLWWSGRYV